MRTLVLVSLAAAVAVPIGASAAADGCDAQELVVNEARATTSVDGATVSIRVWEDLSCMPAGDGFGGPTDAAHLEITLDGEVVCTVDGIDMGNDPFGFGSSVHVDSAAPCGADVTWSGIDGLYLPDPNGPGLTKEVGAAGSVWFGETAAQVADGTAAMSKRANVL